MKTIFLSFLLIGSIASAQRGGSEGTGGGDACEKRIQEIRDDISTWISKGGGYNLKNLPESAQVYSRKMSQYLSVQRDSSGALKPFTRIECVHQSIQVQGVEKTCRFDHLPQGPKITCNYESMMGPNALSVDEQYQLIHHEYAGLAGLELPSSDQSNYVYSNQLSAYLENQVVRRLAVRPSINDSLQVIDFPLQNIPTGSKIVFTKPLVIGAGQTGLVLGSFLEFSGKGESLCYLSAKASNYARTIAMGPQGYRAYDFEYSRSVKSSGHGAVRLILKDMGKEVMILQCERTYYLNYAPVEDYPQLLQRGGVKYIPGPGTNI